jgi:hypothetical protein
MRLEMKRERRGKGMELRVLVTLRSGILGVIWQEIKHRYLIGKNIKEYSHRRIKSNRLQRVIASSKPS